MARPFRGRLGRREQIEKINAAHRYAASLSPHPDAAKIAEQFITPLPPKRNRVVRPVDGKPLESSVNDDIFDAFCKRSDVKLWRNNRGVAQYGNKMVTYGVGPRGASDWIGYRLVYVTQAMVGSCIAQFVAIEAKRRGEKPDDNQQKFIDRVNADGGKAGAATSAEEALALFTMTDRNNLFS